MSNQLGEVITMIGEEFVEIYNLPYQFVSIHPQNLMI
jgi:hypothetical protein